MDSEDNKQINETDELSDYVKDLIRPENIIGQFTDTKQMINKLLED